jgi:hypothetical protein
MPSEVRGTTYLGQQLGERGDALLVHLVRRVLVDRQWVEGTDEATYLTDLRAMVRDPAARLVVYQRQGGHIAGVFDPNRLPPERRGSNALAWLYVVYSADRGTIVSGYQASGLGEIDIPEGARWLK